MKILKFGGTSVGSVKNMSLVKDIINTSEKKIVVLSAMSGTTNTLVAVNTAIKNNEIAVAESIISSLSDNYTKKPNIKN